MRVTFSGITEDPKGHIYDVEKGYQADQFTATTKALASYSGRKCTDPQDIRISIEVQKDVTISTPSTRISIDEDMDKIPLGRNIDNYVKGTQHYRQNKVEICSETLRQCTEAMLSLT